MNLHNEPLLVDALLRWGAKEVVNTPCGPQGDRPLHLAVKRANTYKKKGIGEALLSVLLSHGAHPDAVNSKGVIPVMVCPLKHNSTSEIAAFLSPSTPLPLSCQASAAVLASVIPYLTLPCIPPRIKQLIKLHDKTTILTEWNH